MNGNFLLNLLRTLLASAVIAVVTQLWILNQRVAVLDERITEVLRHSDKLDEMFEKKLEKFLPR